MKKRNVSRIIIYASIIAFFAFTILTPLITIFTKITGDNFTRVVSSSVFLPSLLNTFTTGITATLITMVLALLAAFAIERSSIKCKPLFTILFTMPMLIPSISHAFGIVQLFGNNGLITRLLGLENGAYGFVGIVLGSIAYSFPVAFLMFSSILHFEDGSAYRAADVLGIPKFKQFLSITLPYMKKTLISCFFAVFTMIVTDYGVPTVLGKSTFTLASFMYSEAISSVNLANGSVIATFLLLPAIIAFVVDVVNPEKGESAFVSTEVDKSKSVLSKVLAYTYVVLVAIAVLSPVVIFAIMTFVKSYPNNMTFTLDNIVNTTNKGVGEYLGYSLLYAVLTAAIGTLISFICAYISSRDKVKSSKIIHLLSIISMAIPGLVLGLGYCLFFSKTDLYGTITVVVMANTIHFMSSPYLMMYNSLGKVNPNLESVGSSLGISRVRIITNVIVPKVKDTMLEMFAYFFVNSMMTISAVSFLCPPSPKAVSLMIYQFEGQMLMESAAFVSVMILLVNIGLKLLIALIKKIVKNRELAKQAN